MEEKIFKEGDMVMLNPERTKFSCGQGPVEFGEIGGSNESLWT